MPLLYFLCSFFHSICDTTYIMNLDKLRNTLRKPYGNSEAAFNKLMNETKLPEGLSFGENDGVNLNTANKLIEKLSTVLEEYNVCTAEDEEEAREMIITLENLQKQLPEEKEISVALAKLRSLRTQSLSEIA